MTIEQIQALFVAKSIQKDLRKQQEKALKAWSAQNLDPLVFACDHIYPWGESAITYDRDAERSTCRICFKSVYRS